MNTFSFSPLYLANLKLGYVAGIVDETLFVMTPDIVSLLGDAGVKVTAFLQKDVVSLKAAMNKPSSVLSPQISAANEASDSTFKEVKRMIKAAGQSTLPAKAEAGALLQRFLKDFWSIDRSPLLTQVSLTSELLLRYDVDATLSAAAQTIGIADLFAALATHNTTLSTLLHERTSKRALDTPAASAYKGLVADGYDTLCTLMVKNLNLGTPPEALVTAFRAMEDIRKKYTVLVYARPDIKNAATDPIAPQTYTGKAITPIPVAYYDDYDLVFAKDFSLTYKNNVKVGEATVIMHGKGKFSGTHERRFNIVNEA
jgi:hypothetical protein